MFAVIVYFWRQWRTAYFQSGAAFGHFALAVITATALTAVVGLGLVKLIEKTVLRGVPHAQIEDLFGHLEFIAPALAAAGLLILWASLVTRRRPVQGAGGGDLGLKQVCVIGLVQGLCLPFRGFSRSGATISAGMLLGVTKARAERFSFALAVVLTPPVVVREILRLVHAPGVDRAQLQSVALLSVAGALLAFLAGLIALRWLSRWLESGRWYLFGIYCLVASIAVEIMHANGW
jgi:undecaprenyl-diphosphatase